MATVNKVGASAEAPARGDSLAGRYRLLRRLAVGASGEVFSAQDGVGKRHVVVKLLALHASPKELHSEFARLTELAHPNIVRVLDAGVLSDENRGFIVMDEISGRPLAEVLASKDESRRVATFVAAAEALADALAYLHGRGVCHGDISPANVRCTEADSPILMDFGLSLLGRSAVPASSAATGTLGFMAPEALPGERGQSGDLFALGATLYHAWTGNAPFGTGLDAVAQMARGAPAPPSALRGGLPDAWDRLVLHMLAPAVEDRPGSARELLHAMRTATPAHDISLEAELAVPYPTGDPLAGAVVGRAREEAALREHLLQLSDGAASVGVVWLTGPVGCGRRTLIRRAVREARLAMLAQAMPALDIEETNCTELLGRAAESEEGVAHSAAGPLSASSQLTSEIAALLARLEDRAVARPLCLALDGSVEDQSLAEAYACGSPSGRLLLLVPCQQANPHSGSTVLAVSPLSRAAIAELARRGSGSEPPGEVVERVWTTSGGLAGAAALLVRNWIANLRAGRPYSSDATDRAQDLGTLLDRSFAALGGPTQSFLVAVALDSEEAARFGAEAVLARGAGWLLPDTLALPSSLHLDALWRAVRLDPNLQAVARQAAIALPPHDGRLAEATLAWGDSSGAATAFWAAMRVAQQQHAWGQVAELGSRALQASRDSGNCEDRLALANALGVIGDYQRALAVLDGCASATAALSTAVVERKAWLLGRQGRSQEALALVEEALAELPSGNEAELILRGRIARLLVSVGRFSDAVAAAEPALPTDCPAALLAREAAVLALAYSGRLREARDLLEKVTGAEVDSLSAARMASLDGLVHQMEGAPVPAAKAYRLAAEGYEHSHDLHGAAVATFNLGCVLADLGEYSSAVEALERAVRDLGRLRATADQALAVFNVGQLFLQLGDLDAVARAVRRLSDDSAGAGAPVFRGYEFLLGADLARRRVLRDAGERYAKAAQALAQMGMRSMAAMAELGRAEVLAGFGQVGQARELLDRVSGPTSEGEADASLAEALLLARARVELADPAGHSPAAVAIAERLSAACDGARASGRLPSAWRLASLAFRVFAKAGDERQAARKELARSLHSEVLMKTPAKHWPAMQSDPEAKVLDLRPETTKVGVEMAEHVALLEGRLRRLLRINKRLNSDLRLSRVLEIIIDTVIELTDAERGFLLLKDGAGELTVRVARNIDQTSLEGPGLSLSRSIAKQAAETGQPVITVDAAGDSRFSELLSVSDLHLRSVLAVPLSVKGAVVGTIYVDHRLRKGVFGDDELSLVLDFAEQGAIAIENARVLAELRRREQQVQSLNRRLEHELRLKQAALDDVRVELKESRQAAALRYDYRQIVGQSPAMLEIFRLLDRVTDTNLPVVVEGESGTGKELVARAIHFHGPRRERAFVSENCAAIPETLLESTLFGHVRGAFTGADRDSRGLFAVAHGGTLFLDEVGEMSAAMQGKLLRVLQDGEYHRVGSERPEKVDVRIVAATNKNLAQMVEEGKFRKDLFYRLSVVSIHLPPLRDRREDIPLLLRHFLDKAVQAGGATPKSIEPAAIAKLCSYAWPGNVRELENEIARAGVFAAASIGVTDLSPHIQSGQDAIESVRGDSDNIRLRQRVERLERQLIREAMNRSQGNQTKAAGLLGLSRFGLQKKLRRYSLAG